MKRKVLLFSFVFVLMILFSIQSAFAAEDIASGKYNDSVDWRITSEGALIIGSEGETQYVDYDHIYEWRNYQSKLKTARISGTVIGQNVSFLFAYCRRLVSIDLRGLNTQNSTDMTEMFYLCYALAHLDVSTLDTGKVTSMGNMFHECRSLTSLDLSNFNTSNVTSMGNMFSGCSSLTSLDISSFDMRKVTGADEMFSGCDSLEIIKTPKYLSIDVDLPYAMYDSNCKMHTVLPKNLTSSITLYKEPQHQWVEEITKPATCNADGVKKITCSNCGVTETTVIPKTSHSWDSGAIAKPAKYFSTGVKTYTCKICGATKSQVIPAKNVKAVTPARVKLSGAKVSGKKLTVKWKRIAKNTKGYQVSVKDRKTGKEKYYAVKQSSKATLKKTIKKLKKGRKYAVRVRAYNQIGDEIIYGPWSNVKSGKI